MNRRTFLHRAALALGGALLAPLVGAFKEAEATDDGPLTLWEAISLTNEPIVPVHGEQFDAEGVWVKAFDPADIERAFAEPVVPWDFSSWDGEVTFDTATVRDPTTTGNVLTMDDLLRARQFLRDADRPSEWRWDHLRLGWENMATGVFVSEYAATSSTYRDGTAWREVPDG